MPESHDTARCRSISRRYAGLDLSAASITVNGTERTWCCVLSGLAAHTAGLAHVRCKAQEIRGAGTCTAYSVRGGSRPHRTCLCFLGCWFAASSQGQLCNAFVGFDDHRLGPRLSLLPGQPACKPNVLVVACRCACSSQVSTHHANNGITSVASPWSCSLATCSFLVGLEYEALPRPRERAGSHKVFAVDGRAGGEL